MARDANSSGIRLSTREIQVLNLVVQGRSDKEISSHLRLAVPTVKQYLRFLRLKLSASNRTQLAVTAIEKRFIHNGYGRNEGALTAPRGDSRIGYRASRTGGSQTSS